MEISINCLYLLWNISLWQFGEVLATTEHDEAIIIAEIDYSILEQRRFSFILTKIHCTCIAFNYLS